MKRFLVLIIVFGLTIPFTNLQSQQLWKMRRSEITAGLGPSFFFGDIGGFSRDKNILGFRDLSFMQTRYNYTFSLKYRILEDISARLSFSRGLLHATDTRGSNENRGFEASTSIFESALLGEYSFIKNKREKSYLFYKGKAMPIQNLFESFDFYAFGGIAGLSYSVKGNDVLVNSGKMKTGGFTVVIPIGIGTEFVYTPDLNFGLEIGGRFPFSDYLDGLTTQFSSSNDVYYFFNVTISYKMKTGPNGLPSFR